MSLLGSLAAAVGRILPFVATVALILLALFRWNGEKPEPKED